MLLLYFQSRHVKNLEDVSQVLTTTKSQNKNQWIYLYPLDK